MIGRQVDIHITLKGGQLTYVANVGNTELIAILETCKHMAIRQALGGGGAGRPLGEPTGPASGGARSPGLAVRRADQSA